MENIDKTFEEIETENLKEIINSNRESIAKNDKELSTLKNIIIISNSVYVLTVSILIIIIIKKNKKISD